MKIIIKVLFFCLCLNMYSQTRYYVSNDGNDSNDGLSEGQAWKTLKKVEDEQSRFGPGDIILLKGGDRFSGELILKNIQGESGNPIVIKSFGQGQAIITNGKSISSWKNEGAGIYSSQSINPVYQIFKNAERLKNARSGMMTISNVVNPSTFVSKDLVGHQNLVGASILYKGVVWSASVRRIIRFNSGTGEVTLDSPPPHKLNTTHNKFWIINSRYHIKENNDWVYDNNQGRIFLKSATPPLCNYYQYERIKRLCHKWM